MSTHRDPREIITPFAFQVKPALLGLPLGTPWRRGAAMSIDLIVLSLILLVRQISGPLFWLLIVWVLFRISSKSVKGGVESARGRRLVRVAALIIFLVVVASQAFQWFGRAAFERALSDATSIATRTDGGPDAGLGLADLIAGGTDVIQLRGAADPETARPIADRLVERLSAAGVDVSEIRETLTGLTSGESAQPWMPEVIAAATVGLDSLDAVRTQGVDSLALAYTRALTDGDAETAAALRPRLAGALSGDQLAALRDEIGRLEDELGVAEEAADRGPSLLRTIRELADEIGLGIGWIGLYFTVLTVVMSGQTPGKRLLGLRVVRLNGEPIGWWTSFSRFGGYAACFFTGFMGFFEIFWDANRQGLQDKMVGTVVTRTTTASPADSAAGEATAAELSTADEPQPDRTRETAPDQPS